MEDMTPIRRKRTIKEAIEAMPAAIRTGEKLQLKIREAEGDVLLLADLMVEAIAMNRLSRCLSHVDRNGKELVSIEGLQSAYCMDLARDGYLRARKSNRAQP